LPDYNICTDIKYAPLTPFDTATLADSVPLKWWNQSLCRVNDCVVRLGIFEGEFHWHKHNEEDEMFLVLDGELLLDLENRTLELKQSQGIVVPRGVPHRTRAVCRTVVLMIEGASVKPTGD
jgi:mannose-6-phosphate isomerase-like protein (cupin superfamily)